MSDRAQSQELLSLWLQLLLMILFAAVATVIALYSDSETMGLESTSNIVDIVVCILAIFVARKVAEPANQRYQFGYAKYEPLMTTVEGILMTGICTSAILSSVQDILHPDPFQAPYLIVIYSGASFLISVIFGVWMRSVGKRTGSPLVLANADLWIVGGWLALGICAAFVASIVLGRMGKIEAAAYIDPAVCLVLSLFFLKKPYDILRDSISDLVDANPYAGAVNAVEKSAAAVAEQFHLKGVEWVRVRKAGRRVFVTVSFFEDPTQSLQGMDKVREAVTNEVVRLNPDVDIVVAFRLAPALDSGPSPTPGTI
jgi:ferrous-iron efflux pump FieF